MATRGRNRTIPAEGQADAIEADQRRLQDYPRADRENALKLQGVALRELGQRHGIPKSSMDRMDEAKLRRQISLAQSNQVQADAA